MPSLPPSLALHASCPHPLLTSMGVFVIVALALGQAWLGASLVGTVCTVSVEPSLSSYTIIIIIIFSNLEGVGRKRRQEKSFSHA